MALNKLRGRIVEKYGTIGAFSEAVGLSRFKVGKYLDGTRSPHVDTAIKIAEKLDIPMDQITIFFTQEVSETQR